MHQSPSVLLVCDLGLAPWYRHPQPGDVDAPGPAHVRSQICSILLHSSRLEGSVRSGGQDGFPNSPTREPSYLPLPCPPHQSQEAPTSRSLSSYPMTYHLVGSTPFFPSSEALHVGHTSVPTWALLPGSWLDSETQRPPVREARRGHQPMGWSQQHTPSAGSVLSAELLEHRGDLNKGFVDYTVQACDGAWVARAHTHTFRRSHSRKMYYPLPFHPKPEPKPQVPSSEHIPP